ncbi:MAG: small-conductance mechanosensitive channel [Rickettsiales bacterium]|jgi:small-conductance mechanosensitive channel
MENNLDGISQLAEIFQFQKIVVFLVGILLLVICAKIISRIGNNLINKMPSRRLLILQIDTILIFLIYIVGTVVIFYSSLQPPKELLIALGGSAAVAIGLSLKDLVASLIAGLVLLFDQPFQVGDRVKFKDQYGEIKSIGLLTVRLVTLNDDLVTIPNSRFLSDMVSSGNDGNMDMMTINDFKLAIDADLVLAKELVGEILITSKYIYLQKPFAILISEVNLNGIVAVNLAVKSYVLDVRYEKVFQNEIVSKVIESFNKHKIKRPVFNFEKIPDSI